MQTLETVLTWIQMGFLTPLGLLGLHRGWTVLLRWRRRRPVDRRAEPAEPPRVTVQLPIYNERYVAARLIESVAAIDYPRDRLQIQVLDDSTDDTSEIVARTLSQLPHDLDIEHIRRSDRTGYKAGALEYGLGSATGEFIAVFDADFLPPADLLHRVLPSFADDDVGMVQTRWGHLNDDVNLLTRVQATLLDGHFLIDHIARSRSGRFFNFNGTGGVFRRTCIEEAGGWEHDTITEDLDLSYRAQLKGWRFVFRPDIVCPAELPADMNAWHIQQFRWAKGAIQCGRKLTSRIMQSPIGWRKKIESVFHLWGNFAFPLLLGLILVSMPLHMIRWINGTEVASGFIFVEGSPLILATISVFLYYGYAIACGGKRAIGAFLRLPWMIAIGGALSLTSTRAVLAAFDRDPGEFVRTPKDGDATALRYRSGRGLTPLLELGLAVWATTTVVCAIFNGSTMPAIFHGLFASGLWWTGTSSLRRPAPAATKEEPTEITEVSEVPEAELSSANT